MAWIIVVGGPTAVTVKVSVPELSVVRNEKELPGRPVKMMLASTSAPTGKPRTLKRSANNVGAMPDVARSAAIAELGGSIVTPVLAVNGIRASRACNEMGEVEESRLA